MGLGDLLVNLLTSTSGHVHVSIILTIDEIVKIHVGPEISEVGKHTHTDTHTLTHSL